MMRHRACAACTLAIVLSLAGAPGGAQTARSGGGANAQALAQMQQLAAERTTLQAENAKLKKDLEEARKDRDALKKEHQALDQRARTSEASLKQSQAGRQSLEQELARTKEQTQQLVAKFRETLQSMRELETDRATTRQALAVHEQDLKTCADRNHALYQLDDEVLTHFEQQSPWSLASSEPFTHNKRVQLENFVDEQRSRADDQLLKNRAPPASAAPAAAPVPAAPATTEPATSAPGEAAKR